MAFDIKNVGGFGTGSLGDVTITSASTQVNSYANVTGIGTSGYQVTIGTPSVGAFGGFTAGQEIVFHATGCLSAETVNMGTKGFATILAVSDNIVTLDKAIPIIDLTKYVCQVVTVPHFQNLTVNAAVSALAFDATKKYGGILIAKTRGMFDLTNGMWLAEGKGIHPLSAGLKPAGIVMSNADLVNRWVMSTGNGIAIVIAPEAMLSPLKTTRVGASWSGALGAGVGGKTDGKGSSGQGTDGTPGGAGYGGGQGASGYINGASAVGSTAGGGTLAGYSGNNFSNVTYTQYPYPSKLGYGGAVVLLLVGEIINFDVACFSIGGAGAKGTVYDELKGGGAGFGLIATNTANFPVNTIAYALDTLITNKTSLLTTSAPWDLTTWTSADSLTVTGSQPSGTDRRFVFKAPIATSGARTYPISTNAVAGDTVTINSVTFTAVASGATGNQFSVGASTAATATNLAAVLNANTTINALYTATSSTNIVTLTEKTSGGGNTPGAASKTGTIVIDAGTVTTAVPASGGYYKITGSGTATLTSIPTQAITPTSVLAEGNTAAELAAATSNPGFAGKLVYPAMALFGPGDGSAVPTAKISITGKSNQDIVTKTIDSGEMKLATTDVDIISGAALVSIVGSSTAQVKVAAKSGETWSDYVNIEQANTLRGSSIAVRTICTVPSVASGASATVQKVTVRHRSNDAAVSGQSAEIVMLTDDFSSGLRPGEIAEMRGVKALLKHDGFRDAGAKAWCSFRSQPKTREKIPVGVGNQGNRLTMILGVKDANGVVQRDAGINHNTLQVWFGNTPVDIDFNTEVSEIYGSPPDGVTVFASYSYGWEPETWVPMDAGQTNPYSGTNSFATDYSYTLPNSKTAAVGCVKFELDKPVGSIANYLLGTVTGKQQMAWVPHKLKRETIVITPSVGTVTWVYDEDSGILTFVGSNVGATLALAADWVAETPVATGITACYVQSA